MPKIITGDMTEQASARSTSTPPNEWKIKHIKV